MTDLWAACEQNLHVEPVAGELLRIVESQEQIASRVSPAPSAGRDEPDREDRQRTRPREQGRMARSIGDVTEMDDVIPATARAVIVNATGIQAAVHGDELAAVVGEHRGDRTGQNQETQVAPSMPSRSHRFDPVCSGQDPASRTA
jgi:hypothetical protein